VAAAVGVNRDIIQDGVNGFLASTSDEWIEKIGRLLSDPELRARFALQGRRTIEERYSLAVNAPKLVATLRGVLERSRLDTGQPRDRPLPEPLAQNARGDAAKQSWAQRKTSR